MEFKLLHREFKVSKTLRQTGLVAILENRLIIRGPGGSSSPAASEVKFFLLPTGGNFSTSHHVCFSTVLKKITIQVARHLKQRT